jgi:hypothetical protein
MMRQHFLPRGQYTPECRKGLGQDVLRADEIGIALVIAGDTAKHLSLAVAPRKALAFMLRKLCNPT